MHTTAELVLVELQELTFKRQPDAATGFAELVVEASSLFTLGNKKKKEEEPLLWLDILDFKPSRLK